jgi:hypothetical protein
LSEKIQQGWMDGSVQKTGYIANGKQIQPNVQIRISIFINKMLYNLKKSNFRRPNWRHSEAAGGSGNC